MKKPKRPINWEEDEKDFSEVLSDEAHETRIDLSDEHGMGEEAFDGDDIIDLEDIIELSDYEEDEGDLNLETEILDADSDLEESGDLFATKREAREEEHGPGDDLLKGFALADEEPFHVDPLARIQESPSSSASFSADESLLGVRGEDLVGIDEEPTRKLDLNAIEDAFQEVPVDDISHDDRMIEEDQHPEDDHEALEVADEGGRALPSLDTPEEASPIMSLKAEEPMIEVEPQTPVASVTDLVSQIENKLLAAVREVVEAKLPEVVRTILQEEIERLKKDPG